MTWLEVIDGRIEELQAGLKTQKERTLTFIVDLHECEQVYRSVEDLELQIKTLENIKVALLANLE